MARQASVAKAGFYPASPVAIAKICGHLSLGDTPLERTFILDPCCGKGAAIKQLGEHLGVPQEQTYCIELDAGRTADTKEALPRANVLGPCSFLGSQVTGFSFSLAYVNSPFDTEFGGGRREEEAFVQRATHLLVPHGVLVLVCPMTALIGNRPFVELLDSHYEGIEVYRFPDGTDPDTRRAICGYNEIVVFARKRRVEIPHDKIWEFGTLTKRYYQWRTYFRHDVLPVVGDRAPQMWNGYTPSNAKEDTVRVWEVPKGNKPHTFKKCQMTDEELFAALDASPLNAHFLDVPPMPLRRPPLPLDKGHLGLVLASGILDGVIETPHGPHVVRGSSTKKEYYNKDASTNDVNPETGAVTTRDVYSQKLVTVIKCVTRDGQMFTFSNDPATEAEEAEAAGKQERLAV